MRARRISWDAAYAAWVSGVEDMPTLNALFAGNQLPLRLPYRERRLGPFASSPGSEVGSSLQARRIQSSDTCDGLFAREGVSTSAEWPGIRLRGHAWLHGDSARTPIHRFLATTPDLRVIGVGLGEAVFASMTNPLDPVLIYGMLDYGKVCSIPIH